VGLGSIRIAGPACSGTSRAIRADCQSTPRTTAYHTIDGPKALVGRNALAGQYMQFKALEIDFMPGLTDGLVHVSSKTMKAILPTLAALGREGSGNYARGSIWRQTTTIVLYLGPTVKIKDSTVRTSNVDASSSLLFVILTNHPALP
jgi:hypothetical protein